MRFTLRVEAPGDVADEVRRTLRAFVLFGGIGARTRRGLGALALAAADRELWLPENLKPTTLTAWLAPAPRRGSPVAALHDALVATGAAGADALASWHTAIGWLRDFRQGANPSQVDAQPTGTWARMRPIVSQGPDGRPGRSRWPEPDKLRQLAGSRSFDHDPLPGHGASPYWPRAEFGLPIEIRFQNKRRDGQFYRPGPPENAMLALRVDGEVQDRLASALLVKPVQLRSGQFVPLALWLTRAIPDAWVGVEDRWSTPKDLKGAASLAGAMPAGDQHHFAPLAGHATVREAFMKWVGARPNVQGGKL